jgi:antitoxin FitA
MAMTITVKNIPPGLYRNLKDSAERHRRSINREIISMIEEKLAPQVMNPGTRLAAARALRERTRKDSLTETLIRRAKTEGRL